MNCLNCGGSEKFEVGDRVQPSKWECVQMRKDIVGTVVMVGTFGMRRGTVKVKWDCGHKDQWWPVSSLYPATLEAVKSPGYSDKEKWGAMP